MVLNIQNLFPLQGIDLDEIYFYILFILIYTTNQSERMTHNMIRYSSIEMAFTGQLLAISSQLQSLQSSAITSALPFSTLKTCGQTDSQVPQPMQISWLIFGFDIKYDDDQLSRC